MPKNIAMAVGRTTTGFKVTTSPEIIHVTLAVWRRCALCLARGPQGPHGTSRAASPLPSHNRRADVAIFGEKSR